MTNNEDDRIRGRAYEIWKSEGEPLSKEREYWERNKRDLGISSGTSGEHSIRPSEPIGVVQRAEEQSAYADAEKGRSINTERYDVVRSNAGWTINHDGQLEGQYETKEAAFEAIKFAAANAIKDGSGVAITIPPRAPSEAAMGGKP